jgi:hypothetical protein
LATFFTTSKAIVPKIPMTIAIIAELPSILIFLSRSNKKFHSVVESERPQVFVIERKFKLSL